MNFKINFSPSENSFPEIIPSKVNFDDSKINSPRDNSFDKMLEKISDESKSLEKKEIYQEKIPEKIEKDRNLENKDIDKKQEERESLEKKIKSEKIVKLLSILEKIIQKKKITSSEQVFLTQNQALLQEVTGNVIKSAKNSLFITNSSFLKFWQSDFSVANKLPQEALDQIKKLTELITKQIHTKSDNSNNPNYTSTNSKLGKVFSQSEKTSDSQLEKISDLTEQEQNRNSKTIKLEDIYIKTKDRFNVLKGSVDNNLNKTHFPITQQTGKIKPNPTHQKVFSNNSNSSGTSGLTGVAGHVQKNLVINFSSSGTGEQGLAGREFSAQSFTFNSPLERASGMFTENGLPQSISFKSFIQYLSGKIHNGFINGKRVMMVKLQPENLGQIHMVLKKESENSLHLKLKVDTLDVKELLYKNSHEIKIGLNKNNLDLLSFDVDLSDRSAEFTQKEESRDSTEKKFNKISEKSKKDFFSRENSQTVDLRIRKNLLNIRI